MPGIIKLLVVAVILHSALMGADIFLDNIASSTAHYGGQTGFLPATGDRDHAYDQFTAWLGGGGSQLADPGDQGGIAILQWIVRTPLCGMIGIIRFLVSLTILNYDVVRLIPSDGFGNWFKILVNIVGALLNGTLMSVVVRFAIQAGVFSNVYLMGLVLGIAVIGAVATALNAGGIFGCG